MEEEKKKEKMIEELRKKNEELKSRDIKLEELFVAAQTEFSNIEKEKKIMIQAQAVDLLQIKFSDTNKADLLYMLLALLINIDLNLSRVVMIQRKKYQIWL